VEGLPTSSALSRRAVLAAGAALALAGCGPRLVGARTVRYANWGSPGDDSDAMRLVRGLYEDFELSTGVDLRVENIPGSQEYLRKVLLSYVAKSEPDVITLDASSAAIFIENGVLQDLMPFVNGANGVLLEEFFPNVVEIAKRGDALYALPVDFNPVLVYYNRAMFAAAGVPEPRDGWTFEDFRATARALTKGEQYGFEFANWMPGWIMWLWNHGGDVLSPDGRRAQGYLDAEPCVEAVQFLHDLVERDKVAPRLSQAASMGVDLFANARSAMKVSGHWELVGLASAPKVNLDEVGVVSFPTRLENPITVAYEAGLAMGRHARNLEDAWEFIRFFTSEATQMEYQRTGIAICARQAVAEKMATTEVKQAFVRAARTARVPWGARVPKYDQVERIGQDMMDRVMQHGTKPAEALRSAAQQIDEVFRDA